MKDHLPTAAEAQEQIDNSIAADAEANGQRHQGVISYEQMLDAQEDAAIANARAHRLYDEAIDREAGRKVPVSTRIKRALSKQIFG